MKKISILTNIILGVLGFPAFAASPIATYNVHIHDLDCYGAPDAHGNTRLQAAIIDKRWNEVQKLLNEGADPNIANKHGNTAFHMAATAPLAIMEKLLEYNPDLSLANRSGNTALHIAALEAKVDNVRALLTHGANPFAFNIAYAAPVDLAKRSRIKLEMHKKEALKYLTQLQAKGIEELESEKSSTDLQPSAISYSSMISRMEDAIRDADETIDLLRHFFNYRKFFGVDKWDSMLGDSLLHHAVRGADMESVRALLEKGADPNLLNGFRDTALHTAVGSSKVSNVRILLEYGADPLMKDRHGKKPVEIAQDELRYIQEQLRQLEQEKGWGMTSVDRIQKAQKRRDNLQEIIELLMPHSSFSTSHS